jgi:putative ABC transport system permease protein
VGVVGDVRHQGLGVEPRPKFYIPFGSSIDDDQTYVIKTEVAPSGIVRVAKDTIWAMDPSILVTHLHTFDDVISRSVANPRFRMIFLTGFAALAAVIAVVGIFGVLAYSVVQRTHEIGIRMALGAEPRHVLCSILRRGLTLAGIGLAIGGVLSLYAVRALKSYLFEISPTDPPTLAAVAIVFTAATMAASYIPARRATRVDPMVALKQE